MAEIPCHGAGKAGGQEVTYLAGFIIGAVIGGIIIVILEFISSTRDH